jgi:serine/threonine-protein kinase RsbW
MEFRDTQSVRTNDKPAPTVFIEGDFDFAIAPGFNRAASTMLSKHHGLVVDLSQTDFIDSSGVAALLSARKLAADHGKICELRGLCESVRRSLQISGIGGLFGIEPLHLSDLSPEPISEGIPNRADWQITEAVVVGRPLLVAELRDAAVEAAREAGLPTKGVDDVKLAVGEALVNAMRHGARPGRDRIRLRCMACSTAFVVEIIDQGQGFDANEIAAPGATIHQDGGLGIHLMRSVMDEVDFSADDRGNKVRMLKWIRS